MLGRIFKALFSMLKSSKRMEGRSWATELFARAMKSLFLEANDHDVHWLRAQLDKAGAYHPAVSKASMNTREIAGVSCLMASPKAGAESNTLILYFHGGGYVCGSPKGYKATIAQLAVDSNCLVVAPDYRLAPEHPFPVPQDDCLALTKAAIRAYPEHKIILAGDSAGGALAISTALELAKEEQRGADALVLISPWVDPTAVGGSMKTNEDNDFLVAPFLGMSYAALMQDEDYSNPRTNFLDVDLSPMPKTLVQCGGGELFFDQIQTFCERAIQADVDLTQQNYDAQFHVFQMLSGVLGDAKHAMAEIADFIKRV